MAKLPSLEALVASGSRVGAMPPRLRWIWLAVGLGLLALVAVLNPPGGRPLTGPVVSVVDPATIHVQLGNRVERVRYIGITAPEIAPHAGDSPASREATEANRRLVEGRTVRLELDVQARDQSGRLLAYVHLGDTMVNAELVRLGFARVMAAPPNLRHQALFVRLEREAREEMRGVWAEPGLSPVSRP